MIGRAAHLVDAFERAWTGRRARLARSGLLATTLLGGVALIEAGSRGLLPESVAALPDTHLAAIAWTVTLLLIFETVEMVLSLGRSVAESVARHLQLYALVLLRDAFVELSHFPEPIRVSADDARALAVMGTDAAGAVALFVASALFARMQRHVPITPDPGGADRFVRIKKTVAAVLLMTLVWLTGRDAVSLVLQSGTHRLFDTFFTVLVFVDVLLAVISLGISDIPAVVFRNFGFAFAAILLRLAIASPEFVRPGLGLAGAATAIVVTLAYNFSSPRSGVQRQVEAGDAPRERGRASIKHT